MVSVSVQGTPQMQLIRLAGDCAGRPRPDGEGYPTLHLWTGPQKQTTKELPINWSLQPVMSHSTNWCSPTHTRASPPNVVQDEDAASGSPSPCEAPAPHGSHNSQRPPAHTGGEKCSTVLVHRKARQPAAQIRRIKICGVVPVRPP